MKREKVQSQSVLVALSAVILALVNGYWNYALFSGVNLGAPDSPQAPFTEKMIACMPTTLRPRHVDYVTAAVRSFRQATRDHPHLRRLVVFVMDKNPSTNYVAARLARTAKKHPWLTVLEREDRESRKPTRMLHGDPPERVQWRSKEALDYIEVLRRCTDLAKDDQLVVIFQDDVEFDPSLWSVTNWADDMLRRLQKKVCVLSLSDIKQKKDGAPERIANMVAKIYDRKTANEFVDYASDMFDHSPIDWLIMYFCKDRGQKILVRVPNPVHHKGLVSTFSRNRRNQILT
mmetsp:Transcript_6891/g.20970  ORF Transcript_6891/g.20970 Transcript_6891/m.20970 type:complete len:289 (-) Transcript_6891:872-1738(-)